MMELRQPAFLVSRVSGKLFKPEIGIRHRGIGSLYVFIIEHLGRYFNFMANAPNVEGINDSENGPQFLNFLLRIV